MYDKVREIKQFFAFFTLSNFEFRKTSTTTRHVGWEHVKSKSYLIHGTAPSIDLAHIPVTRVAQSSASFV